MYVTAFAYDNNTDAYYGETLWVPGIKPISADVGEISAIGNNSIEVTVNLSGILDNAWLSNWGIYISKYESEARHLGGVTAYYPAERHLRSSVIYVNNLEPGVTYYITGFVDKEYNTGEVKSIETVLNDRTLSYSLPAHYDITIQSVHSIEGAAHDSAVFSGFLDVTGITEITEKGFVYSSVTNEPTVENSTLARHPNTGGGEFSMTVSSLIPGNQYYVRAYAKNAFGEYIYSDYYTFFTEGVQSIQQHETKEAPYMTAIGLNMFGPDNNGTNMEVACVCQPKTTAKEL